MVACIVLLAGCMSGGRAPPLPQHIEFTEQLTAFNGTTWGLRVPSREDGIEYTINTAKDGVAQREFESLRAPHISMTYVRLE